MLRNLINKLKFKAPSISKIKEKTCQSLFFGASFTVAGTRLNASSLSKQTINISGVSLFCRKASREAGGSQSASLQSTTV